MSLRQEITPSALLGRVTSAFWTIHFALGPVGAAVLTGGASRYGAPAMLVLVGIGSVVISASGRWTALR